MSTINHTAGLGQWAAGEIPLAALRMSEAQFEAWALANSEIRAEWVEGKVVVRSPASQMHSSLTIWLSHLLSSYLELRPVGDVYGPEFMIRLAAGGTRRVPDLLFVSAERRHLVKETYLDGPPDLVVEVVSKDSPARDWREKYLEYEAAGVREYWIVDPFSQRIEANALGPDGKYVRIEEVDGKFASTVLPGLYLRNAWLWSNPRPTVLSLFAELGLA